MKTRCPLFFRSASALFILLALTLSIYAQPQYYNYNAATNNNAFPFNTLSATGKTIQTLYPAGTFNQPSGAPAGLITKFYVQSVSTVSVTYTQLTIKMAQTTDVDLPTGAWYTGTMSTVFDQSNYSMSPVADQFIGITLSTPFNYDPTKSLIVEITQCGYSGTGFGVRNTTTTGTKRHAGPLTGAACPHLWGNSSAITTHTGIDVAPVSVTCSYTWSNQTSGTTSLLYSVKTVNSLVGWAAGAAGTVRRTTDGGATWTNGNPNPGVINGDIYNIEALDANTAWCTTSPSATFIYKTTNGGTNWTQVYTVAGGFINAIKMYSPTNGIATGDVLAGVWLILGTTDGGSTWTVLSSPTATGDGRNNCLQVLSPNVWFGTGQGTIWKSTNLGVNWTSYTTTSLTGQVLGVHYNSATIGLGSGATMVKSTDGGLTYAALTASGTGNISGIQGNGNDFWYTRGSAIFRSTDNGGTWTQVHTPTAVQNDISLVLDGSGCMTGWSCGASGTICKMVGVPVGINDPSGNIPSNYSLSQNYPNPFNPTTSISFALPVAGNVELKVYDMLGKEVASLVSGSYTAGTHSVPFDASALASGVYVYKLSAGDFTDSKKMVLIK